MSLRDVLASNAKEFFSIVSLPSKICFVLTCSKFVPKNEKQYTTYVSSKL